jgi:DNA-binding GntR family transcriptional regulator
VTKEAGRGAFLLPFDPSRLEGELQAYLQDTAETTELREVRAALEIGALAFAVPRATADDLGLLRRSLQEMEEAFAAGRSLVVPDRAFHDAVMNSVHNGQLASLRAAVLRTLQMRIPGMGALGESRRSDENTIHTARSIVRAFEERDRLGAESAMQDHLILDLSPRRSRVFLFVDDVEIAHMRGLWRTIHAANKHWSSPVLRAEQPWEGQRVEPSATVLYDPERTEFRMWYHSYRLLSPTEEQYGLCYAVSLDGIHWRKPALDIASYEGYSRTNLLVPWGEVGAPDVVSASIMEEPTAVDPARRYVMIHYCSGFGPSGLGLAFSPDGLHWQRYVGNPVDIGGSEPTGNVLYAVPDGRRGRYLACYRVRLRARLRRTLACAESADLLHWAGHRVILEADEADPPGAELSGLTPFRYGDLLLGLLWVAPRGGEGTDVQLAVSRDGETWSRVGDRQPFLARGSEPAFDSYSVRRVTAPVMVGDELWFYYSGIPASDANSAGPQLNEQSAGGIGLASITLDRFVSLDAGDDEAELATRPVMIGDETRLLLNVVVNAGGYVLAELLDASGEPVPGFDRRAAHRIDDSGVFVPATWAMNDDLRALAGEKVQMRFWLRRARLFAYRLCRPDSGESDLVAGLCS